jgi:hypothetical protein
MKNDKTYLDDTYIGYDAYLRMVKDCLRWKKRAMLLERALIVYAACHTCTDRDNCIKYGKAVACTIGGFLPEAWQFDEARFTETEDNAQ